MMSTAGTFFPRGQGQSGQNGVGSLPYLNAKRGSINSIGDASPEKFTIKKGKEPILRLKSPGNANVPGKTNVPGKKGYRPPQLN